jgi:two-component system, OmpR family, KDP operon response regulator KdpE
MKFMIIENNPDIIKELSFYLRIKYLDAVISSIDRGVGGTQKIVDEMPDFAILDSSLPDIDHLLLINQIREYSQIPLLVLSDEKTDADRAKSLEMGADDLVPKPFNPIELLARIGALIRRSYGLGKNHERPIFISKNVSINFTTREVFVSGVKIHLTPIEYGLLSELAINPGQVITHRVISERVWRMEYNGDHSFIKKYIYLLRSKLESNSDQRIIVSERGIGYKLVRPPKLEYTTPVLY